MTKKEELALLIFER